LTTTNPTQKQEEKPTNADITTVQITNLVSIYLRDVWRILQEDVTKKKHNSHIVDVIPDSVLVADDARNHTISGPVEDGDRHEFLEFVQKLKICLLLCNQPIVLTEETVY
jgi:preprotein translocase subunit SecA